MTTVFTAANVVLAATPPDYFLPNTNGAPVPAGLKSWQLLFDCTGLPDHQLLMDVVVEYQRNAWTDVNGVNHPAGEWMFDTGGDIPTGPTRTGSKVVSLGSTIGATRPDGSMVEPYPTHVRLHVTNCPGWIVPRVTLNLF